MAVHSVIAIIKYFKDCSHGTSATVSQLIGCKWFNTSVTIASGGPLLWYPPEPTSLFVSHSVPLLR